MFKVSIFDLDGTVICSRHRYRSLPNGDIDLPAWIKLATPENIARDSLLPLAETWRECLNEYRHIVLIATARVMSAADYQFLHDNGLGYSACLSRPLGYRGNDADLKELRVRLWAESNRFNWDVFCKQARIFEDNQTVLDRFESLGIQAIDSRLANVA